MKKISMLTFCCHILMDTKHLFNNPLFSDIRVIIAGQSYHAHKVILGSQSEYFKTRFNTSIGNPNEDVTIEDPTFLDVLKFIYGASQNINKDNMETLAKYADMYLIEGLKKAIDVWLAQLDYSFDNCMIRIKFSSNPAATIHSCIFRCTNNAQMTEYITNLDNETFAALMPYILKKKREYNDYDIVVTPRLIKWIETSEIIDINMLYQALEHIHFKTDEDKKECEDLKKLTISFPDFDTLLDKTIEIILCRGQLYRVNIPFNLKWKLAFTVLLGLEEIDKELDTAISILHERFYNTPGIIDYYVRLFMLIKNERGKEKKHSF